MLEMEEEMEGKKVEELVELLVVKKWRKWVVMASQEAWAAVFWWLLLAANEGGEEKVKERENGSIYI